MMRGRFVASCRGNGMGMGLGWFECVMRWEVL